MNWNGVKKHLSFINRLAISAKEIFQPISVTAKQPNVPPVIGCRQQRSNSQTFRLLGTLIEAGTRKTLQWNFPKSAVHETSIVVVRGKRPGPVLCLTAALHGDEINGVEITRQIMQSLDPDKLSGIVIGIPIINLEGYLLRERLMGDHSDLNRCFPGRADGPYSEQVANALFTEIILHCDALIDLHTGSTRRENLPQLRADLTIQQVADFSAGFKSLSVLQSTAPPGSLRSAATAAKIPAVVAEIGGSQGLDLNNVLQGVEGLHTLLNAAGMTTGKPARLPPQHIYHGSGWIRAEAGGILVNKVQLGDVVQTGEILAEIIEPLTCIVHTVTAPFQCTILGRVHNQVVDPGYGLFRVGIES